jgi:tetratricopeptide (TPR) repeat protein
LGKLNDLNDQANALKAAGRMEEAIAAYRAIVDIAPGNAVVMHNLAAALGDAGRHAEALEWGRRAISAGMTAAETSLVIARSNSALGNANEAKRFFIDALNKRPTDAVAHKELAQLEWMLTGDREKSLQALNAAAKAFPQALDLRLVRAQVIGQTGDAGGEYEEVLAALKAGGGHPQLQIAAANSALAAGAQAEALAHAEAASAALPNDPGVRQALARALLAVGEALEALRVISRLHAEYPLDQFYVAVQATCWRLLGDERYRSVYDYERFVAGFPLACPKGWASAEAYVDDLIEALDRHHQYKTHPFGQSVRQGSQLSSIDMLDDPPLKAVGEAVRGPITSYIAKIGAGPDPLRIRNRGGYKLFSIWSIRLASSGFHVNHVHPQGWLSSASHLRYPEPNSAEDRSGWLTFGEPGIPTAPPLTAEHFVRPEKGVMVVFPSYMWHGTVPFSGETTRLTIAGDSVPATI